MIHLGKNTRSTIVSKGISAGRGQNTYRGLVKIMKAPRARETIRNATRCSSVTSAARTPSRTSTCATARRSWSTSVHVEIGEDQIFYLRQRGLSAEDAVSMIVNGFCKEYQGAADGVRRRTTRLLGISLEGSVG